jgi:hypothetical protein
MVHHLAVAPASPVNRLGGDVWRTTDEKKVDAGSSEKVLDLSTTAWTTARFG